MNYLRGAVSAISAPYQYYKDLNPSTLTGAIDVIVVHRPKQLEGSNNNDAQPGDEDELVCSPFHVRFGKWQVLRPGDKKVRRRFVMWWITEHNTDQVNVFVNGNPVPFPMKIGEAGEAFFVFETDEDIPDDLVTSPLLAATRPGQSNADVERAGRFGAKEGSEGKEDRDTTDSQEPDFLDLNAPSPPEPEPRQSGDSTAKPSPDMPDQQQEDEQPSLISRTAQIGKAVFGAAVETEKSGKDKLKDKSVKDAMLTLEQDEEISLKEKAISARTAAESSGLTSLGSKGDEVLPDAENVQGPEVVYADGELIHLHVRILLNVWR